MRKFKKGLWLSLISLCVTAVSVSAQTSGGSLSADTKVNFPVVKTGNGENYLNTVTTTGPDGKKYKLVQQGDMLPKLAVNGLWVPNEKLDEYAALIGRLEPILQERQNEAGRQKQADATSQQAAIIHDLVNDQIVKSRAALFSYSLTEKGLVVNGKDQPETVFIRYRKKFIASGDMVCYFNH